MPHWWIRIQSSPPVERAQEVRDIVASYSPAVLVGDTIFYEEGVTRFAWALIEVPEDFGETPQLLDALKTVGSKRFNKADRQQQLLPPPPPAAP